jgi:hypothetical protein
MIVFVTTSAGNQIIGGGDIWVNNFIQHIVPTIKEEVCLIIDNKRPAKHIEIIHFYTPYLPFREP